MVSKRDKPQNTKQSPETNGFGNKFGLLKNPKFQAASVITYLTVNTIFMIVTTSMIGVIMSKNYTVPLNSTYNNIVYQNQPQKNYTIEYNNCSWSFCWLSSDSQDSKINPKCSGGTLETPLSNICYGHGIISGIQSISRRESGAGLRAYIYGLKMRCCNITII